MKTVEIVPRPRTRIYGVLVAKEEAIREKGRGTYMRVGRKARDHVRWKHKAYRGSVDLRRTDAEGIAAKVRSSDPEDERKLLSSFLKFVDRYSDDRVHRITIEYQ
ncbi:MAG TPA: hypothetical protein VEM36_00025 [Xanthobacteraceae bacterium]|nr:hypothetical protein [Xanthobacteraceae bacterium]